MRAALTAAGFFAAIILGIIAADLISRIPAVAVIATIIFFAGMFTLAIKAGLKWVNR
jgi:hypothetical protein